MNPEQTIPRTDPFAGYFGSVILALIVSGWMAGLLVEQFAGLGGYVATESWRMNATAGMFLGIVAANPFTAIFLRHSLGRASLRFLTGMAFGITLQITVITPFTDEEMLNFLLLFIAGMGIPVGITVRWLQEQLLKRNLDPIGRICNLTYQFLNWSDRVMFITLMGASFLTFEYFGASASQILVILLIMLSVLITSVSGQEAECESALDLVKEDFQAWLAIDPDKPAIDRKREGVTRLKGIVLKLLPGAIMFGGMLQLALYFSIVFFPELKTSAVGPVEAAQNLAILSLGGTAVFLLGMTAALIISLIAMRIIGGLQNWSNAHLREKNMNIIRLMNFRPIERYWVEQTDSA